MTYSYDRTAAEDIKKQIEGLSDRILDGAEYDEVFKALSKLTAVFGRPKKKDIEWSLSRPEYRAKFVKDLHQTYAHWSHVKERFEAAKKTVPKAKELLGHLLAVQGLQKELLKDPGADYFQAQLNHTAASLDQLVSLLDHFIDNNGL